MSGRPLLLTLAVLAALLFTGAGLRAAQADPTIFRRGDSNADGIVDLGDAVKTVFYIYLGGTAIPCLDAADSSDSDGIDLVDVIHTLSFLFLGGLPPDLPGPFDCGIDPTPDDALSCDSYPAECPVQPYVDLRQIGHLLNRLGYGPSQASIDHVREVGLGVYIEEQLHPESIDESGNSAYLDRENALFDEVAPSKDRRLVSAGDIWKYFKGSVEPPANWKTLGFEQSPEFNQADWTKGETGIGYGDNDDATVLADMQFKQGVQAGYASVYLRKTFNEPTPASVHNLILRIDYDDGFVAYLNGEEVARKGLTGSPPLHNALATSHEVGTPVEIDITAKKGYLVSGQNDLAIQVHNNALDSPDLSMIPELIDREILPGPMLKIVKGVDELQQLIHVRGIYSEKQLQAVLGEFWENHFTTDLDKVADYFNALQDSDATDSMGDAQARREAAQVEYLENRFFYDNALGTFGDLLLASATSPSMLIYLDNVLNVAGSPNENYAREILELFAFGVDNRYVQKDIEQLAKCFTGWSVCKVTRDNAQSFPQSALSPPEECGVIYQDTPMIPDGPGWKCFKGTAEPSPDPGGLPITAWTEVGFDDGLWLDGTILSQQSPPKGIGYGDGDDTNVPDLSDMRYKTSPPQSGYASVYLRRKFEVPDPASLKNLILEVAYDDAYVAYLNGVEVARSKSMGTVKPPAHNALAPDSHEVTEGKDAFNLNRFRDSLIAGTNVLSIQVHNSTLDSSDLSMIPSLVDREILPGSIENSDPSGVWTFHFDPARHDTTQKILFDGTLDKIVIPAGRTGMAGLQDALEVGHKIANHISTKEFISIKLIQKFVSDQITLATYKAQTAPIELRELLAQAIAAWDSTSPPGNIRTVLEAILDPVDRDGEFWAERNYRSKVKTAVEFINSTIRVLDGSVSGVALPGENGNMGMYLFLRDEPDGYSELGLRWIDTARMLNRIRFVQSFTENLNTAFTWNVGQHIARYGLDTAQEIVDRFDELLFQKTLAPDEKARLLEFLTTDDNYVPKPLDPANSADFTKRVAEFVGLCLSLPQWNYQ